MNRLSWWQKFYWSRFAKPVEERTLVRFLIDHPIASLLEIGVGDGSRLQRIAKFLQLNTGCEQLRYIGVDEFEASTDTRRHLSLKHAHQIASQLGFKSSLIPGTPTQALARVAHKFGTSDLILIDGGIHVESPATGEIGIWLNRLAHSSSTIFARGQSSQAFVQISLASLELAASKAA